MLNSINKETILDKLKNLTVFELKYFCALIFILYITIDIVCKKIELNKYDLESIVTKIKEERSRVKIGFQNIIVSGEYLYINNGKLKRVDNSILIVIGTVLLFGYFWFFINSVVDIRYVKLKDLRKVIKTMGAGSLFFGLLILSLFIFLFVPFVIRNMINSSSDVTNIYLQVNNLDGYHK